MQALIIALAFLVFVIAAVGLLAIRTTVNGTAYINAAGQMRMLSQRMAKESQQGLQGGGDAFARLKKSRDEFAGLVDALTNGGSIGGTEVPASSDSVKPALEKVSPALAEDGQERRPRARAAEEPGAARQRGEGHQQQQPGPPRPRRAGLRPQAPEPVRLARDLALRPARHADPADGEERQRAARLRRHRPGGHLPARQGLEHLPRHPAGALQGQRQPARRRRPRPRDDGEAEGARRRLRRVPPGGELDPRQPAAAREREGGGPQHRHRFRGAAYRERRARGARTTASSRARAGTTSPWGSPRSSRSCSCC